jgi:2-amino-4-hydroxy-6-hydroxymethyldihydropteridine diphosphokinase
MPLKNKLYLLLGANLGDRLQSFFLAQNLIVARVGSILRASSVYETAPWGVLDQPSFLNQVLEIETELSSGEVLPVILAIEQELGRVRHERWAARVIDIDILYYNNLIIDVPGLTIPHPRLQERRFTLAPLAEIARDYIHPVFGKTNLQLLSDCRDESDVSIFS